MSRDRAAGSGDLLHVPSGHIGLTVGRAFAVVRPDAADAIRLALRDGTLHEYARVHATRELSGRLPAYATRLGGDLPVVVRHNTHGGALAGLTGDRFRPPTRAPRELDVAVRLRAAGVATPGVVAIVRYPAGRHLERADVATEEIPDAVDLAHVMQHEPALHTDAAEATAALLRALAAAGARHADLNLKNVLVQRSAEGVRAWVLDVDRVTFGAPGSRWIAWRNWRRFMRSARKWREKRGVAAITEEWLAQVQRLARDRAAPRG